jgi:orotate phosphoribosyltransferase
VTDERVSQFITLVSGRRGHFRMESGLHGQLWLDLDSLFADPHRVEPFVAALTDAIRPYAPDVVCGPLVGGAFLAQLVARALGCEFAYTERFAPPEPGGLFRVRYELPRAFRERLRAKRIAIVDDVMSAGSALRGTYHDLQTVGAVTVVAGALLVQGTVGEQFFANERILVEAVARDASAIWPPDECPLCRDGVPLAEVDA